MFSSTQGKNALELSRAFLSLNVWCKLTYQILVFVKIEHFWFLIFKLYLLWINCFHSAYQNEFGSASFKRNFPIFGHAKLRLFFGTTMIYSTFFQKKLHSPYFISVSRTCCTTYFYLNYPFQPQKHHLNPIFSIFYRQVLA